MKLSLRNRHPHDLPLTVIFLAAVFVIPSYAYQANRLSGSDLKQDYDAAQQAHSQGDMARAASYSKLFVVHALHLLATNFANVGDFPKATALFDEGLLLEPGDVGMRLDYVQESVSAGDLVKAKQLAQEAVERAPRDASAHLALGRVLLLLKENLQAQKQLETAVALDANYPDGLALARADLALKQEKQASTIFSEMLKVLAIQPSYTWISACNMRRLTTRNRPPRNSKKPSPRMTGCLGRITPWARLTCRTWEK